MTLFSPDSYKPVHLYGFILERTKPAADSSHGSLTIKKPTFDLPLNGSSINGDLALSSPLSVPPLVRVDPKRLQKKVLSGRKTRFYKQSAEY